MKNTHRLLLGGLFVLMGQGALGQSVPTPQDSPPVLRLVDENGVDLISQTLMAHDPGPSVGLQGLGVLSRSNFLYRRFYGVFYDEFQSNTYDNGDSVSIGDQTYAFGKYANVATNVLSSNHADGNTLNVSSRPYVLTDRNGVVTRLGAVANGGFPFQSVTYPTGEVLTYNYDSSTASRLRSVTSNRGYQLHFEYSSTATVLAPSKVVAINNAVDYCGALDLTCTSLTQTWPSVTYTNQVQQSTVESSTATDALGRVTTYSTTAPACASAVASYGSSQVATLTVTRPSGNAITYTRWLDPSPPPVDGGNVANPLPQIISCVTTAAGTWTYSSNAPSGDPVVVTVTDPLGRTHQVTSYNGVLGSEQDNLGNVTTYNADIYGRTTKVIHPEGNYEQYAYDSRGNVLSTTRVAKSGTGLANVVTSSNYDTTCVYAAKCNKPNSTVDGNGNTTTYTYSTVHGGVLSVVKPAGNNGVQPAIGYTYAQIATYAKNSSGTLVQAGLIWMPTGQVSCATSAATITADASNTTTTTSCSGGASDAVVTTISYAGSLNAQPTSTTTAAGDGSVSATTTTTYDFVGNVLSVQDSLGAADTITSHYDAMRQKTGVVGPTPGYQSLRNRAIRTTYNGDGLPSLIETGTQSGTDWSSFSALEQESITYDGVGRKSTDSSLTSGLVRAVTQFSYDSVNNLTCSTVRMNPAAFNSLPASACTLGAQGSDGPDRISYSTYDADNRPSGLIEGYGTSVQRTARQQTYTPNGKPYILSDGNGNQTKDIYDGLDRLYQIQYPDSSSDYEQYGYDANFNRTSERRRDGSLIIVGFDALNQKISQSSPATSNGYDNLGHLTSSSRAGISSTWGYDALGRVTSESGMGGTFNYRYDLDGHLTQIIWPDAFIAGYSYDLTGEVTQIQEGVPGGSGPVLATYSYDNLGLRTGITRANGVSSSYGYDSAWRVNLLEHSLPTASNSEQWTFGRNTANQITRRSSSNAAYDWTGPFGVTRTYQLNSLNQVITAAGTSYSYDLRGNLTSDTVNTFGYDLENNLTTVSNATGQAQLQTDGTGRLAKVLDLSGGAPTSASRGLRYLHDKLLAEYGANSGDSTTLYRRYIPGPMVDETLVWYDSSDSFSRRWLLADERGSVVAVTDSTGGLSAINTYDEYGVPAASNQGRFQYTGQIYVAELGLYHYKARDFSPGLGRFLQTDPIGPSDDVDLYAYVKDDPLNKADPTGHDGGCVYTGGCGQIANNLAQGMATVVANTSVSVSLKAQATAGPVGTQLKVTADSQTMVDGSVAASARTATGGISVQAQATVDVTVGQKDVGTNGGTVSVRAGLVGGQVSAGDKGVNAQVSIGPQIGVKVEGAPSVPANGGASLGSTRVDVGAAVQGAANQVGQAAAIDARNSAGCGWNPC